MTEQPDRLSQADLVDAAFAGGWETLTIEQRGPDGTEVLAMLVFLSCPMCRAVVPAQLTEGPTIDFASEHRQWHLDEAEKVDEIVEHLGRVGQTIWPGV